MTMRTDFLAMMRRSAALALALFMLAAVGCDSADADDEDPPPPVVSAPDFNVSSIPVQFDDGTEGIVFFAVPDEDIVLVRVDIVNPRNMADRFNAGSTTVLGGEEIALQEDGFGYFRVSGTWTFTFVGRRAAGDQTSFEVVETVDVGA